MIQINLENLRNIDSNIGIKALVIEGSNPALEAIVWTKANGYQLLSIADVYQRVGFEGIQRISMDQLQWTKEAADKRKIGTEGLLRVEGYTLFNSYFLSRRTVDKIADLSTEDFNRMDWFKMYIAHNSQIDVSDVKQIGNDPYLVVSENLENKFVLQDLSGIISLTGAPWHSIAWLEGDLLEADQNIYEKLFGQPIDDYKHKVKELGFDRSRLYGSPLLSAQLTAMPVKFDNQMGFSFSAYPFWHYADSEGIPHRIDRIYVMPVMKK